MADEIIDGAKIPVPTGNAKIVETERETSVSHSILSEIEDELKTLSNGGIARINILLAELRASL